MEAGLVRDFNHGTLQSQSSLLNQNNRARVFWQRSVKRKYDLVALDGLQGSDIENAEVSGGEVSLEGSCRGSTMGYSEVAKGCNGTVTNKGFSQRWSGSSRDVSMLSVESTSDKGIDPNRSLFQEGYSQWLNSSGLQVPSSSADNESLLAAKKMQFQLPPSIVDAEDALELEQERIYKKDSHLICRSYSMDTERTFFPKKRGVFGNFPKKAQTFLEEDCVQDSASESEVLVLREALRSEREALHSLYIELEEERCASESAANETMAMIARLQEEKAAVLMEARQYRRLAEEREVHDQEAIALLKEILMNKEEELLALQDQMEAYRSMFFRIESGGLGRGTCGRNFLEEGSEREGLLFIEGQETDQNFYFQGSKRKTSYFQNLTDQNGGSILKCIEGEHEAKFKNPVILGPKCSKYSKRLVTDGVRMNLASFFDDGSGFEEEQIVDALVEDPSNGKGRLNWEVQLSSRDHSEAACDVGDGMLKNPVKMTHSLGGESFCESRRMEEAEEVDLAGGKQTTSQFDEWEVANSIGSPEQRVEGASLSILERVRRLEERFQYLGKKQVCEDQRLNVDVRTLTNEPAVTGDVGPETVARNSSESVREAHYHQRQWCTDDVGRNSGCSCSGRSTEDFERGYCKECSLTLIGVSGEERNLYEQDKYRQDERTASTKHFASPCNEEKTCSEGGGDALEGVHDVYEVQCENHLHHSEHGVKKISDYGECRNQLEKPDVLLLSTLQDAKKDHFQYNKTEGITATASRHAPLSGEAESSGAGMDGALYASGEQVVELQPFDVKDDHKSMAGEEVQQLKLRLQALEGERFFMNQAIQSLKKENLELKLLQEIAQQLRELKGTVKRPEQSKETSQQEQSSILSFFKGILSLTGLQSTVHPQGNKPAYPFQKKRDIDVNQRDHVGLCHLLEMSPPSRTSWCVTRGLKVRLTTGGENSHSSQTPLPAVYC